MRAGARTRPYRVIGAPFESNQRELRRQSGVERVMHEQLGEHRDDRAGSLVSEAPGMLAAAVAGTDEEIPMAVSFQLVIDCADPEPLARFWAARTGIRA